MNCNVANGWCPEMHYGACQRHAADDRSEQIRTCQHRLRMNRLEKAARRQLSGHPKENTLTLLGQWEKEKENSRGGVET